MKKLAAVIIAAMLVASCATSPVGMRVSTSTYNWNPSLFLRPVTQNSGSFSWEYTITRIGDRRFRIDGRGEYTGSQTWTSITSGSFALILLDGSIIISYIVLPIMWTDLSSDVEFTYEFKSPSFTHNKIYHSLYVRG